MTLEDMFSLKGRVALVTGGPGHANAVSALYTASMSESPVVLLSGHAPLAQLGKGAFQEMRQADMAAPVTKASWTCSSADALAGDLHRAIAIARAGRPGPVHLEVPLDLMGAPCPPLPPPAVPVSFVDASSRRSYFDGISLAGRQRVRVTPAWRRSGANRRGR